MSEVIAWIAASVMVVCLAHLALSEMRKRLSERRKRRAAERKLANAMETIDVLERGRLNHWHTYQATREQVWAYLQASDEWGRDDHLLGPDWTHENGGSLRIHKGKHNPDPKTGEDIIMIAIREDRPELAVWREVMAMEVRPKK